jgi:hypothetical protein
MVVADHGQTDDETKNQVYCLAPCPMSFTNALDTTTSMEKKKQPSSLSSSLPKKRSSFHQDDTTSPSTSSSSSSKKHKYDLSDRVQQTLSVLDPSNTNAVRAIINDANRWCRDRMVWSSLAQDYVDVWDTYVTLLNRADPLWASGTWGQTDHATNRSDD